jgi:hypothetical protein
MWSHLATALLCLSPPSTTHAWQEPEVVGDPRLRELVTLDGEHPWDLSWGTGAWPARARELRQRVLVASGLWPLDDERPHPVATVHGRLEREGYTIQRVFFETWPGFYLTGNLYLPTDAGESMPAVLSPHGHQSGGRLSRRSDQEVAQELACGAEQDEASARYYIQARCHQLARLGCVVFHYDMVGYGDSRQLDHQGTFLGLEFVQHGLSAFGFQTYNSLRALDYLLSLPGVDPKRVGVTGASGGGTQTFILGAIDPRPAAAFPAVMVSTEMQGGCICENAPYLRIDTNNVELAACFAPRPLALSAANDWTMRVEKLGMPQLREVYALCGAPDHVAARTWPQFEHNYNRPAREFMYSWFNRHLALGATEPVVERAWEPATPAELSVFDAEHPLPADALGAEGIAKRMLAQVRARNQRLVPRDPAGLQRFRAVVGGALEIMLSLRSGAMVWTEDREKVEHPLGFDEPMVAPETERAVGLAEESGLWNREDLVRVERISGGDGGSPVEVAVLRRAEAASAAGTKGGTVIAVSGSGVTALLDPTSSPGAALEQLLKRGNTCVLPLGLLGEPDVSLPTDAGRHASYSGYTFCYNRTLIAERVRDLGLVIEAYGVIGVAGRKTASSPADASLGERTPHGTTLWGQGRAGPWALLAASQWGELLELVVADWSGTFAEIETLDHPNLLPGALGYGGLDAFTGLLAPLPVTLCGLDQAPTAAAACYRITGTPTALSVSPETSAESW